MKANKDYFTTARESLFYQSKNCPQYFSDNKSKAFSTTLSTSNTQATKSNFESIVQSNVNSPDKLFKTSHTKSTTKANYHDMKTISSISEFKLTKKTMNNFNSKREVPNLLKSPFPLLRVLSNKKVPNNSKNFLNNLMKDHLDPVEGHEIKNYRRKSAIKVSKSINTKLSITNETKSVYATTLEAFSPESTIETTQGSISENNKKRKINLSILPINNVFLTSPKEVSKGLKGTKFHKVNNNSNSKISKIDPVDNYTRNAYKLKKIIEGDLLITKLKTHMRKISKKENLIKNSRNSLMHKVSSISVGVDVCFNTSDNYYNNRSKQASIDTRAFHTDAYANLPFIKTLNGFGV